MGFHPDYKPLPRLVMGAKDMIEHTLCRVSPGGDGTTETWDTGEAEEADMDIEEEEEGLIREDFQKDGHRVGSEFDGRFGGKSSPAQVAVVVTESAEISKDCDESSSGVAAENVLVISKDHISLSNDSRDGKSILI